MKLKEISNRRLIFTFSAAAGFIVIIGWAAVPLWKVFFKSTALGFLTIPLESLALAVLVVLPVVTIIAKSLGFSVARLKKPWRRYIGFLLLVAILIGGNLVLNSFGYLLISWHEQDPDIRWTSFRDAQGLLGFLLILSVVVSYFVGIYLWHSEVKNPKRRRLVYYASISFSALILFSLLSGGSLSSAVNETFFQWFTVWRGNRMPDKPVVAVLQFSQRRPSEEDFTKLLALAAQLEPAVIAIPGDAARWDSTEFRKMQKVLPLKKFILPSRFAKAPRTNWKTAEVVQPTLNVSRMVYTPARDFPDDMALAAVEEYMSSLKRETHNLKHPITKRGRILLNHYVVPQTYVPFLPFHMLWIGDHGPTSKQIFTSPPSGMYIMDFRHMKVWKPQFLEKRSATGGRYSEWDLNADVKRVPRADIPGVKKSILLVGSSELLLFQSPEYAIATVAQNMIDGDFLEETSLSENFLFALILLLAMAATFRLVGRWKAVGVSMLLAILTIGALYIVFARHATLVDPTFMFFTLLVSVVGFFPYELAVERSHLLRERTRLSTELQTAHEMQMGLMPKEDPVVQGFDLSGICIPASEVGGDFYDYVWLDKKKVKLGIALADVSGKAMKAAMTAVMTSGMLYSESQRNQSPREILARINQPLYLRSDKRVFTALSFAVINSRTKKLTYSSAGQSHPILIRNGILKYIRTDGARLPLGVKDKLTYRDISMKLRKGDTVVFYTDGVPEAMNNNNELYGFDRFENLLKQYHALAAIELRDKIVEDVRLFTKGVEQHDDLTVVVVKVV